MILDAAAECYQESGHAHTSISEIASRAGVARGTVYKHVGDRAAITTALLEREFERYEGALLVATQQIDPMPRRIVEIVVYTVRYAREHRLFQRLLEEEPERVLPTMTLRSAPLLNIACRFLEPQLRQGIDRGELPATLDVTVVSEWIARITLSLIHTPPVVGRLDEPGQLRQFVGTLLHLGFVSVSTDDRSSGTSVVP